MRIMKSNLLICLNIIIFCGCVGAGSNFAITPTSNNGEFPKVVGQDLIGREIEIPEGLGGDNDNGNPELPRLVVVAYLHEQQKAVDTWIVQLEDLRRRYGNFPFYEMPVIESGSALFRFTVQNGMRSGIWDEAIRRRTVTVFTSVVDFNKPLGVEGTREIQVVLLDRGGMVLGREAGEFSLEKGERLFANYLHR